MSESVNSKTRSGRRPYRLWLAGVAAGALVTVSLAPPTGWIARGQIATLLGIGGSRMERTLSGLGVRDTRAPGPIDRRAILESRPHDFPLHLAAAMETGAEMRRQQIERSGKQPSTNLIGTAIRGLAPRFENEPGLYAAALRMDTLGWVRIVRPESGLISGDKVVPIPGAKPSDPANLATFDQDAAAGERLEPDNAYFPMMRAVGYYVANNDPLAIQAVQRAAERTGWNEHLDDEVTGKWRLAETETGGQSAIHRTAIAAGILFPHYAQMRAVTRLATLQAMRLEEAGKPAEAAKVRVALMRVGELMRVNATSLIGNLVGIADTQIAASRPGGAPAIKATSEVGHGFTARERDETTHKRIAMLADYWDRNGLASLVPTMRARCEAGLQARQQVSRMVDSSPFNAVTVVRLAALWCGGTIILSNAWWLLVAGGLGSLFVARRRNAGRERMPRSGPVVLAIAGVLFAALCLSILMHLPRFIGGMSQMVGAIGVLDGGATQTSDWHLVAILASLGLAIPAVVGIASGIVSIVRRVPLRIGLAQGFCRAGQIDAWMLVLAFCGLCVVTARAEQHLNVGLEQTLHHEGRYLSELTGQTWPGPIQ